MKIRCVWEHNCNDSILYSVNFAGAFTRGESRDAAIQKMSCEIRSYLKWKGDSVPDSLEPIIVQEKNSGLAISDADTDVLFDEEKNPLNVLEYEKLKTLALKSRTAFEMYEHTKNVNGYYFSQIGVLTDNEGDIVDCRKRGFALLESQPYFLKNSVYLGDYDEEWSLRKVLRRFIWHDRIHAKAMYRMAIKTFGDNAVQNVFQFDV